MKHFWTQPLSLQLSEIPEGPARSVEHSPGGPHQSSATQLNSQNVNKVNKINLPLAMQYRSSLQLPPKVLFGAFQKESLER